MADKLAEFEGIDDEGNDISGTVISLNNINVVALELITKYGMGLPTTKDNTSKTLSYITNRYKINNVDQIELGIFAALIDLIVSFGTNTPYNILHHIGKQWKEHTLFSQRKEDDNDKD